METQYSHIPMDDEWDSLCEHFEVRFRKEFKTQKDNSDINPDEVRLSTRDKILPMYPQLEFCYKMHGLWHEHPWEEQPLAAQKGRKIAGIMFGVAEECIDEVPESVDPPEPSQDVIEGARWSTRSAFHKATHKEKHFRVGKTKIEILAESLKGLQCGWYVDLSYHSMNDATREQALIDEAVEKLGWNDGNPANTRAYRSRIRLNEKDNKIFMMRVERLESPVPKKRIKRRVR